MANTKITSDNLDTLTTLTVDDITIDGSTISDSGNLTIDYKTSNSIRLRQQVTASAINNILFNVPWIIWNGSDATDISIHRADKIQVGSGVSIGVNGNVVATGIVTATTFSG